MAGLHTYAGKTHGTKSIDQSGPIPYFDMVSSQKGLATELMVDRAFSRHAPTMFLLLGVPRSEFQLFVHNGFDFFGANRVADELVGFFRLDSVQVHQSKPY